MNLIRRVAHRSVRQLVRTACWLTLLALAAFALSVVYPIALPVIFGMSIGHGILAFAFVLYLLAVIITMSRKEPGWEPYRPAMSRRPPEVALKHAEEEPAEPPTK